MNWRELGLGPARDFQLLIPSSYGNTLKASGPVGPRPDIRMVGAQDECAPSRLPRWVAEMKFTFRRMSHPLPEMDGQEIVQNVYHYDDFFIASETIRNFLVRIAGGEAEVVRVDVRHDDGRSPREAYFAVKILRTIDCIDLTRSMANRGYVGLNEDLVPFEQDLTSLHLTSELASEFANVDGAKYVSCPRWQRAKSITLIESRIPADTTVFRPAFWPGHLIATKDFDSELASLCSGVSLGYCSWRLPLSDPHGAHMRLMKDLR